MIRFLRTLESNQVDPTRDTVDMQSFFSIFKIRSRQVTFDAIAGSIHQ